MSQRTCPYCSELLLDPRQKTCREHRIRRQVDLARERKIARRPPPKLCPHCSNLVPSAHHRICGSVECKRARDAAQARKQRAKWTEAQRRTARAAEKRWREANPDRVRHNNRQAYIRDPERYAKMRDDWRAKNPDRHLQISALSQSKRRAAKLALDSRAVPVAEWLRILHRANGFCFYCGQKAKLTQDHVVPLARGGRHAIGNLAPACDTCNKRKGSMFVMEWRRRCALVS